MRGEAIASRSFVSSLHHFVWLSLPSFFLSSILAGGSGRKERSERRTGRQARGMSDAKRRLGLYSFLSPSLHRYARHSSLTPFPPPVVGLLRHPSSSPPEPEAAYGVR